MAGLAVTYSKELIKELDMIPVYYPGTQVSPGDVISFKHRNFFGKPQSIGQFTKEASLKEYFTIETETDKNLDPIRFSSKEGVSMEFDANVDAATVGSAELKIIFSKSGATFMAATGMFQERIKNLDKLRSDLVKIQSKFAGDWSDAFIVTSLRIAKKAIVMQSNSSNGSLTISGDVNGIQTGTSVDIGVDANLSVKSFKDAALIKDWSENVELFFGLARFRKKFLGGWTLGHGMAPTKAADWELATVHPREVDFTENQ